MSLSFFRKQMLELIISECGKNCHYCHKPTRVNYLDDDPSLDHATLDHKIPKSKGGSNARENLVLACNKCNNAKSDRSYEDFVAPPYRIPVVRAAAPARPPKYFVVPVAKRHFQPSFKAPLDRACGAVDYKLQFPAKRRKNTLPSGTMAAAIERGEMTCFGEYKKPKCEINPEPSGRITPIPYAETMWILTGRRAPRKADLLDKR